MRKLIGLFLIVGAASAQANLIVNGGFEEGTSLPALGQYESVAPGSSRLTGWTVSTAEIAWANGTSAGVSPFEGDGHIDLFGFHDSFPSGVISQSIATEIGQTYRVGFSVGSYNGYIPQVQVTAGSETGYFVNPDGNFTWKTFSWDFVASSTSTEISFKGGPNSSQIHAGLDGVSVVQVVPEPASLVMLGLGGLGLLRRKRTSVK